jgi:integrase
MASISTDDAGLRRLIFTNQSGQRKTVYLGRIAQREAERIQGHVEEILSALGKNRKLQRQTMDWLTDLGDDLAAKLAAAGLVVARPTEMTTLGGFIERYRARRTDVAKGTNANYGILGSRLLAFFPAEQQLHAVTEGDADRWLVWLKTRGYAGPTVSKSIKIARQLWAQAVRDGLATANPFKHLRTPSEVNTARAYFVDRPTFAKVLEACPDHEWRLLLALARYGGLRTPSEPLALEWSDVNWERGRFRVVAPKTKHDDGGERWVPIFPELLPILEAAFERAEPGTAKVVTRWRDSEQNLRTGLLRILRRAGVKAWPRLYQNLRATRETELCERFPIHVAAEWLGNSPKTALAHYTQTTEQHFLQAITDEPTRNPTRARAARTRLEATPTEGQLADVASRRNVAPPGGLQGVIPMTPTGFEPVSRP